MLCTGKEAKYMPRSVRVLVRQIAVPVCHIITCCIQYHLQCKVIYVVAELSKDEVILACRMIPLLPTSWQGEVVAQFEDGLDLPPSWHVYVNGNGVIIVGILSDPWPVNGNPEQDHRWLCMWRLRPLPLPDVDLPGGASMADGIIDFFDLRLVHGHKWLWCIFFCSVPILWYIEGSQTHQKLWFNGPEGRYSLLFKQAPRGALFRSDLAWSGKRCDTYSYFISTRSRKLRCSPCRLWYGST